MITLSQGDIRLQGKPLHRSPDSLLDAYNEDYTGFLNTEAQTSAGSYFLHDPDNKRIITSPGYAGGYISDNHISDTIRPLLKISETTPKFNEYALIQYLSGEDLWPFRSLFENIDRLPPGSVISYEGKKSIKCYISPQKGPFSDALERTLEPLTSQDSVTLMYSGGADSTALYAALRTVLNEDETDLSVVSIDIGPNTNSTQRALHVGKKLGIEVEPIEFGWPPKDEEVLESIISQMRNDVTNALAPHHAFASRDEDVVLSGQNFDAMLTCDMHRPQVSMLDHLRSTKDIMKIIQYIILNTQFTSKYQQSAALQYLITTIMISRRPKYSRKIGTKGYLSGLLSSGFPNIHDPDKETEKAVEVAETIISQHATDNTGYLADVLNYYQYQHNANKGISTQPVGGTRTYLPAMWGPFASRHLGRRRPLTAAYRPKSDVYKYVKQKFDVNYLDIAYPDLNKYREQLNEEQTFKSDMDIGPLVNYADQIDSNRLIDLCPHAAKDTLMDKVSIAKTALETGTTTKSNLNAALKILNLNLLID